jgi:ketosteroid isomerase-like protein
MRDGELLARVRPQALGEQTREHNLGGAFLSVINGTRTGDPFRAGPADGGYKFWHVRVPTAIICGTMSRVNVEILGRGYRELNAGNPEGFFAIMHAEIEFVMGEAFPGARTRHGLDEMRAFSNELAEVFDDYMLVPESFGQAGNRVVAFVRAQGRHRDSGLSTDSRIAQVWTMREGRAIRLQDFGDRNEALEAVGLREDDLKPVAGVP